MPLEAGAGRRDVAYQCFEVLTVDGRERGFPASGTWSDPRPPHARPGTADLLAPAAVARLAGPIPGVRRPKTVPPPSKERTATPGGSAGTFGRFRRETRVTAKVRAQIPLTPNGATAG